MKKTSPLKAIRKKCLECMAGNANEVRLCHLEKCPLRSYRFGKKSIPENGKKILTSVKSIRAFCIECSVFNVAEVKKCEIKECPLFKFRMGRNPNIKKREGNKGNIEALKKYHSLLKT